ncbi:MAG: hypothetical protein ACE5DN_02945, partial [Flavobacteriales bacterium]
SYPQNASTKEVLSDILQLKEVFDKLEVVEEPSESVRDPETGVTTVGRLREIKISEQQLDRIIATAEEIRNKYIEP